MISSNLVIMSIHIEVVRKKYQKVDFKISYLIS